MNYENVPSQTGPYDGLVRAAIAALFVLVGLAIYVVAPTWTRPFAAHYIGLSLTMSGLALMLASYILFDPNTIQRQKFYRAIGYLTALSAAAWIGLVTHTIFSGEYEGGLAAKLAEFIMKRVSN